MILRYVYTIGIIYGLEMNVFLQEDSLAKPIWAQNAQKRMKQLGITQLELSNQLGLKTVGAIGHWFNGRRTPTLKNIELLADCLKIPITELFIVPGESKTLDGDAKHLNDALMLLCRAVSVPKDDVETFFKVFELLGSDNILKAVKILSDAENEDRNHTSAVIDIFDFISKSG